MYYNTSVLTNTPAVCLVITAWISRQTWDKTIGSSAYVSWFSNIDRQWKDKLVGAEPAQKDILISASDGISTVIDEPFLVRASMRI